MRTVFQRARTLLLALTVLTAGVTGLWAASEVRQGGSPLTVDKTASGQKVSGTVTVYYEDLGPNPFGRTEPCLLAEVNLYFFMRLESSGFSGVQMADAAADKLCYEDIPAQQAIVEAFVSDVAIPAMFGQTPQSVTLKGSNKFVQDNQLVTPMPLFATMDVEFAVRF